MNGPRTTQGSSSLTAAPTWSERITNAVAAWIYWHDLPSGARMDRAFKESGVRDLVVERDRYREALVRLSGWNNWNGQDVQDIAREALDA